MTDPFLSQSWYRVAALKPRLRAHTQIHRHRYRDQAWYVLYDPASGKSHRVTPAAYLCIGHMNGQHSVDEIWDTVVAELGDDAPTQDDVIELLSQLHAADMLQTNVTPDTAELFERFKKQSRQVLKGNLKSPFSFRVPLWDPDHFLGGLVQFLRPFAGWFGIATWLAIVIPALVIAGMRWSELTANVFDTVFAAQNIALLVITYPVVKLLHELGHGFVAKAHGGEVHELGVMFLVFFPVPYV
ncbi:MAG: PqqD family peptide modification chaperone, partial [Alphaproteobacteria bacterium]|nr:PqqD family peptide modification chaperone [Alphaproteobacteria bacterium]